MRVLVAFDKFKDCLDAARACAVTADELSRLHPDWTLSVRPLADGGEGFCAILTEAVGGVSHAMDVTGPRADVTPSVRAGYGIVEASALPTAARVRLGLAEEPGASLGVVEMAAASGLALLPAAARDVWRTQTRGVGELLRECRRRHEALSIVLGLGGSATHDLGLGALAALGVRFLDTSGRAVTDVSPGNWNDIAKIGHNEDFAPPRLWLACDVTNPLLGPTGAAAVYARQKGLSAEDFPRLETATERMALLLCEHFGRDFEALSRTPGAGAAGGIAFGLMVACGARLTPGFELVADWLRLEEEIAQADLVITGEGSFDASSLDGKGPGSLVRAARTTGKPAHVFAGRVTVEKRFAGCQLHEITPAGMPLTSALRGAETNLRSSIRRVFGA